MEYFGDKLSVAQSQVSAWASNVRRSLQEALGLLSGAVERPEGPEAEETGSGFRRGTSLRGLASRSRESLRSFSARSQRHLSMRNLRKRLGNADDDPPVSSDPPAAPGPQDPVSFRTALPFLLPHRVSGSRPLARGRSAWTFRALWLTMNFHVSYTPEVNSPDPNTTVHALHSHVANAKKVRFPVWLQVDLHGMLSWVMREAFISYSVNLRRLTGAGCCCFSLSSLFGP